MYNNTKMVGRRSAYAVEIQFFIKNCYILGTRCEDIFDVICYVYGHNEMSFSTVTRWFKEFKWLRSQKMHHMAVG